MNRITLDARLTRWASHLIRPTVRRMNHKLSKATCSLMILASMALTGCQGLYSGQVLPSPHYRDDDVDYFARGPEFKLAREAAALEEARAQVESETQEY